jgi:hypothetical protein
MEGFAADNPPRTATLPPAVLAWLAKHFLMGDSPRDARNRNPQHQKPGDLQAESHPVGALMRGLRQLLIVAPDGLRRQCAVTLVTRDEARTDPR